MKKLILNPDQIKFLAEMVNVAELFVEQSLVLSGLSEIEFYSEAETLEEAKFDFSEPQGFGSDDEKCDLRQCILLSHTENEILEVIRMIPNEDFDEELMFAIRKLARILKSNRFNDFEFKEEDEEEEVITEKEEENTLAEKVKVNKVSAWFIFAFVIISVGFITAGILFGRMIYTNLYVQIVFFVETAIAAWLSRREFSRKADYAIMPSFIFSVIVGIQIVIYACLWLKIPIFN